MQRTLVQYVILPLVYSPLLDKYEKRPVEDRRACFLLLRNKYFHGKRDLGPSPEEYATSAPLHAANIADVSEYFVDVDYDGGMLSDKTLVQRIMKIRPDLIILSTYDPFKSNHPFLSVMEAIHSKCRIPIVQIWHDSVGEKAIEAGKKLSKLVDLNIEQSASNLIKYFGDRKCIRLWTPSDPNVFYPGEAQRDIPVSFVGSTTSYRDVRVDFTQHLQENNVGFYHTGGQLDKSAVSIEEYAAVLRRSKISLNFSFSIPGWHQEKARVFEILFSGAMLMESNNEETKLHYEPMVDFVPFDTKEDLLDKVRYYLDHEEERQEIAHNGYLRTIQEYNQDRLWELIAGRLSELNLFELNDFRSLKL
jgi:hypothetical protein